MDHRLPPFKGSCRLIIGCNELINGLAQFQWRSEAGSLEGLTSQNAKPTLHLVQPQSIGRACIGNERYGDGSTSDPFSVCGYSGCPARHAPTSPAPPAGRASAPRRTV